MEGTPPLLPHAHPHPRIPPPLPPLLHSLHPFRNRSSLSLSPTPQTSLPQTHFGNNLLISRRIRDTRAPAIRTQKFDLNSFIFGDDNDDDGGGGGGNLGGRSRRRRRRRRLSGRQWKQRQWRSDEDETEIDEARPGILKQVVNDLWILKVLRSYGWFSPIILLSLLLATGPKAFLMAFSIPFGLSFVILAFEKLWGWPEVGPKPRRRRKSKSPFGRTKNRYVEEEEDREEQSQQRRRKQRRDYESQVAASNGGFGGWDELVIEEEMDSARTSSQKVDMAENPEIPIEKAKLSRSIEERDMPLLLRLLVAVFPFLGTWTSLL